MIKCSYNYSKNLEFDVIKDAANFIKHGISLSEAKKIEWDTLYVVPDMRHAYGEARMKGIAYIDVRLHVVIYVDRNEIRRIISLRKANRREVNLYAQA